MGSEQRGEQTCKDVLGIFCSQRIVYFFVGAIILAGLSEYVQTFVPGRTFNPIDFYSNVSGIIVGIIAPKLVLK